MNTQDEKSLWLAIIESHEWLSCAMLARRAGLPYRRTARLLWQWAGEGLVEVARVAPRWHYRVGRDSRRVVMQTQELLGKKAAPARLVSR